MARIADKCGLTNRYRQIGTGKRVVRRGRPRKYLFGSPKRRVRKNYYSSNSKATNLNNGYMPEMNKKHPVAAGLTLLFIIILLILVIVTAYNKSSSKAKNTGESFAKFTSVEIQQTKIDDNLS